jgi:hypothetical protein
VFKQTDYTSQGDTVYTMKLNAAIQSVASSFRVHEVPGSTSDRRWTILTADFMTFLIASRQTPE